MARAGLGWSGQELADQAGISRKTVHRFESYGEGSWPVIHRLRSALEAGGATFLELGSQTCVGVRALENGGASDSLSCPSPQEILGKAR